MFSTSQSNLNIRVFPSSTSSRYGGNSSCILSNSDDCFWWSENEQNSSIEFLFVPFPLKLTKYSITYRSGMCPFDEWIVEGSKDGINYVTIDYQEKQDGVYMCTEIREDKACLKNKPFSQDVNILSSFHFIKLTALNKRICDGGAGYYSIQLQHIELIGRLKEFISLHSHSIHIKIYIYIFLLCNNS